MPDMPAHTYEALNRAIAALGQVISSARYGNDRKGIIPVLAMPEALAEIADAASVIAYFDRLNQPLTKVEEEWDDEIDHPHPGEILDWWLLKQD